MRIFFSILGICIIALWAFRSYRQELTKQALKDSTEIVEAKILDLRCGRKDNIIFLLNGEKFNERIYLNTEECHQLQSQDFIKLKFDKSGTFIFANHSYNDWSEAEGYSIILLSVFLIASIYWYQLRPSFNK